MTEMSRKPEAVAEAIRKAQRIAVCSHVNPDGDTLGCATAMRLALMKLGKEVSLFCDGKVQRNAGVRLLRDNVVVFEGKLSSLRHLKDDVKEMAAGYECGMSLEGHNDIKEGDIVECYIMEEIPR